MTMPDQRILFGTELRRRRTEAGLSLAGLARLVHYSKSHLSKVETGGKPPTPDLARRCDTALSCDGALAQLAGPPPAGPPPAGASVQVADDPEGVWVLSLDAAGEDRFGALGRRELLAGGMSGLAAWATLGPGGQTGGDAGTLASFRGMFDELRRLGQHLGAPVLLPVLVTQTHALRRIAAAADPANRTGALRLAARFAEYAGWLAQETGDDGRALWWTSQAVELASAGGDPDLAAYADVRRALVTLYRHDATQTVALARRTWSATADPRIRGLAAQREAQGHALAGDAAACWRAIDRAADLLSRPAAGEGPTIGTSHVADPAALAHGWCRYDLGDPAAAAAILTPELAGIPADALRARARLGARLALAHADCGELEQACQVIEPVLAIHQRIGSATIRADLRRLARTLNRWHGHRAAGDTRLRLNAALSTAPFPVT